MRELGEIRTLVKESAFIILAAALVGFGMNLFHPRGYLPVGRETLEQRRIVFISVEEAKIKYDGGSALFIDTRSLREYDGSHIAGAVNIPAHPESLSLAKTREYLPRLRGNIEAVLYCSGETCDTSEVLARRLLGMGYSRHIYIIAEGIPRWVASGYEVREGAENGQR